MPDITAPSLGERTPPGDFALYQGIVVAWNAIAGTNTVRVRGRDLVNLTSLVGSETGLIRAGDPVCVVRLQSTWAVFGRFEQPGVQQRAFGVEFAQTVTLNDPSSTSFERRNGPQVSVYIGSSRRAIVTLSAEISISNNVERMGFQVIGASSISAVEWRCLTISSAASEFQASRIIILTEDDGLQAGLNTFQTMHKTSNNVSNIPLVGEVQITVQPF